MKELNANELCLVAGGCDENLIDGQSLTCRISTQVAVVLVLASVLTEKDFSNYPLLCSDEEIAAYYQDPNFKKHYYY